MGSMKNNSSKFIIVLVITAFIGCVIFLCNPFLNHWVRAHSRNLPVLSSISCAKGHIAFSKDGHIYSAAMDGTGLKQLTSNIEVDSNPCFSSDGHLICFQRQMPPPAYFWDLWYGYNGLMVMNADGTNQRSVISAQLHMLYLDNTFSPDGKTIAFYRQFCGMPDPGSGVCEINIDGSGFRVYDVARDPSLALRDPSYSANGSLIYANQCKDVISYKPHILWVINKLTHKSKPIGILRMNANSIAWSPDHQTIVFTSNFKIDPEHKYYSSEVCVADTQGRNFKRLTNDLGKSRPTFTEDGTEIIFVKSEDNQKSIMRMHEDGTHIQMILTYKKERKN